MPKTVFASYAEDANGLIGIARLAEGLRAFGGRWQDAPVIAYRPEGSAPIDAERAARLASLGVEVRASRTPAFARWFFYGGKPFAASALSPSPFPEASEPSSLDSGLSTSIFPVNSARKVSSAAITLSDGAYLVVWRPPKSSAEK